MILYDTTEVIRTGTRKFHAAWAEGHNRKVIVPPTEKIPSECFPRSRAVQIEEHPDTLVICQSMALGAKVLLTSDDETIKAFAFGSTTPRK